MNCLHNLSACPLCDGPNDCQLASTSLHKGQCWCYHIDVSEEVLQRVPRDLRHRVCLCRNCLTKKPAPPKVAVATEDFYSNDAGQTVFTAAYLQKRGHCCDNGCRHCPYD